MQFFSESDLDPKTRKPLAAYPSWYNPRHLQGLEDEVAQMEFALESGQVPKGYEPEYRDTLNQKKESLKRLKDLTLVEDGRNDRGKIGDAVKEVGKILREEMPSSEMMKDRLVDAHGEFQKMTTPYVSIKDSDNLVEMAKACNVPISDDGKVTREGLSTMWKIGTKYLGDYANTELLRKKR